MPDLDPDDEETWFRYWVKLSEIEQARLEMVATGLSAMLARPRPEMARRCAEAGAMLQAYCKKHKIGSLETRKPMAQRPIVLPVPEEGPKPQTIRAKFASRCSRCGRGIVVGSQVEWRKGSPAKHVGCGSN